MHAGHELLAALALMLCTAAVTTIVFRALRQPIVLGYVLAGVVIGPHVPVPLVADAAVVQTLSELGVVLLMFFIGLEFSVGRLVRVGPSVLVTAVVECAMLFWLGFAIGRLFGWNTVDSLFVGAVISISSTTIIAKAFEEAGTGGRLRELVIGVLLVEDLVAVLLIAILTAVATGAGLSAGALVHTASRLAAFLVALVVVGLLVVPRAIRALTRRARPETVTVAVVGFCFGVALLAKEAGYSVALGAFLAGSLVAESGEAAVIARVVQPLRDVFGAVFFISVGMMIDPALIVRHWAQVLALAAAVVVGKVGGVTFAAFLSGKGTRTSIQAGMSLAQIGEFSFIIAGLGISLGATSHFLFPIAVAVSSLTTLLTPWLIRSSGPVASWVDRRLPPRLQTLGALYARWLERIRAQPESSEPRALARRFVRKLAIDVGSLVAILVGAAVGAPGIRQALADRLGVAPALTGIVLAVGAAVLCVPFVVGVVRVTRGLSHALARAALPPAPTAIDLAAAPRRALATGLQLAVLLLVGVPVVAVTQPFIRGFRAAELLLLVVVVLGVAMWRAAGNVEGHVRAGAEVVVEALRRRSGAGAHHDEIPLAAVFAGLGDPVAIELHADCPAIGRTLGELDLRGATGATVLAITRGEEALVIPSSRERLRAGDTLAIAGTRDALAAARALLHGHSGDARSMTTVLSAGDVVKTAVS